RLSGAHPPPRANRPAAALGWLSSARWPRATAGPSTVKAAPAPARDSRSACRRSPGDRALELERLIFITAGLILVHEPRGPSRRYTQSPTPALHRKQAHEPKRS